MARRATATPRRAPEQPRTIRVVVDLRPLQDYRYATKGIGQHGLSVIRTLLSISGLEVAGVADPTMDPLPEELPDLLHDIGWDPTGFAGDVFLNLSPVTHDTSTLVTALRGGMFCMAVVHDFIPLHDPEADRGSDSFLDYMYLIRSLDRYGALLANSDATLAEIRSVLPGYAGKAMTLHCRSRFAPVEPGAPRARLSGRLARLLPADGSYVFVASADDPRKNPDVAIRASIALKGLGLRVAIGGGFAEASQARLKREYPRPFLLADPVFLPRLSDQELRQVYECADTVVVPSKAEGFSLPVAEAVSLRRPVAASGIAAHAEQVIDGEVLFDPLSQDDLLRAVRHVRERRDLGDFASCYRVIPYEEESAALAALLRAAPRPAPPARADELVVIGPGFAKPTGVAVYNRLLADAMERAGMAFRYEDVDDLAPAAFYDWLLENQLARILYVMGNNDRFHARCYEALRNIPGLCIMHDSRLFEFLLNREGPHPLVELWNRRRQDARIGVHTIENWQANRRDLRDSFLDPLLARTRAMIVHSRMQVDHLQESYGFTRAHYVPFASQMTSAERKRVLEQRRAAKREADAPVQLVMFGETEANKACVEIIYALAMLRIAGVAAELHFVGKSEGGYHAEIEEAARRVDVSDRVFFHSYVTREAYLGWLGSADIAIQLRHPLFGQVSGPVSDTAMCGVPLVTSWSLAHGMEVGEHCEAVPDRFSPLHVAEAVRRLLARGAPAKPLSEKTRSFDAYVAALARVAAATEF
jgi:glycosyltransferase involved in cell wall biosynthesis